MANLYSDIAESDKVTSLTEDITSLKNKVTHVLERSLTVYDDLKDLFE